MRATWYVLEDGTTVDPSECSRKGGVLTHKNGIVAMRRPDCPRSIGVDLDSEGKLPALDDGEKDEAAVVVPEGEPSPIVKPVVDGEKPEQAPVAQQNEDMLPEPKPVGPARGGYRTRAK